LKHDKSFVSRRILVIDDNRAIRADFNKILRPQADETRSDKLAALEAALFDQTAPRRPSVHLQFDVDFACQGIDGINLVKAACDDDRPYAVAFVDMRMPPGMDGLDTIQQLFAIDPEIQVVVCTAFSDQSWEQMIDRLGMSDRLLILKKPFAAAEVSQLACALTEKWRLGRMTRDQLMQVNEQVVARTRELKNANSRVQSERKQRKKYETQMRHDSLHDELTNLPNRALLVDRIQQCMQRQRRDASYGFAVLLIDLDNFKMVNEGLGHAAGDAMLQEVAKRVADCLRESDTTARADTDSGTTARLGGDEFVILLDGLAQPGDVTLVAERIQESVSVAINVEGHEVVTAASIGIAVGMPTYSRPEELLRDADIALHRAKDRGKGCWELFEKPMHTSAVARLEMEEDLRKALDHQELRVNYQPIVSLESGRVVGLEALTRWLHPQRGFVSPVEFIAIAERTGFIIRLGEWVLREACKQAVVWRNTIPQASELAMSVNISSRQFTQSGFLDVLDRALADTGLPPEALKLEITESVLMEDSDSIREIFDALAKRGVKTHLDDFGTGYSSLSYLHNFPVAAIKVDQSFVRNLHVTGPHGATIQAVVTLAHTRGMYVIAEGVETVEHLAQLQGLDCDYGQGYYFARPLEPEDCSELLRHGGEWRQSA